MLDSSSSVTVGEAGTTEVPRAQSTDALQFEIDSSRVGNIEVDRDRILNAEIRPVG